MFTNITNIYCKTQILDYFIKKQKLTKKGTQLNSHDILRAIYEYNRANKRQHDHIVKLLQEIKNQKKGDNCYVSDPKLRAKLYKILENPKNIEEKIRKLLMESETMDEQETTDLSEEILDIIEEDREVNSSEEQKMKKKIIKEIKKKKKEKKRRKK